MLASNAAQALRTKNDAILRWVTRVIGTSRETREKFYDFLINLQYGHAQFFRTLTIVQREYVNPLAVRGLGLLSKIKTNRRTSPYVKYIAVFERFESVITSYVVSLFRR